MTVDITLLVGQGKRVYPMPYSTKDHPYDLNRFNTKQALPVGSYVAQVSTRNQSNATHQATIATIPASQFLSEIKSLVSSLQSSHDDTAYQDYLWRCKRAENDRARETLTRAYQAGRV